MRVWPNTSLILAFFAGSMGCLGNILPIQPANEPAQMATNGILVTGILTDLAIQGRGWFVIRNPFTGWKFATRRETFYVDGNGYVVSWNGFHVQGYTDRTLSEVGDLQITNVLAGLPYTKSFAFCSDGKIETRLSNGQVLFSGQVLLQDFDDPDRLVRVAPRIYYAPEAAKPHPMAPPGTLGLGMILPWALEVAPEPVRFSLEPPAGPAGPLAQGALTRTGRVWDFGIVGPGFFLVRDPATSELFATRAGLFLLDREGYLITYDRLRVQGYSSPTLDVPGDIQIDRAMAPVFSDPAAILSAFSVRDDGTIVVQLSDGTEFARGRIRLFGFHYPDRLTLRPHGLYAGVLRAEPEAMTVTDEPWLKGIRSGTLELINVSEDLLTIRRGLYFHPQGAIRPTQSQTDLALSGEGLFVLRDVSTLQVFATRSGAFHLDQSNYLVSEGGLRVQGFSDARLSVPGDIQIDGSQRPAISDPTAGLKSFAR